MVSVSPWARALPELAARALAELNPRALPEPEPRALAELLCDHLARTLTRCAVVATPAVFPPLAATRRRSCRGGRLRSVGRPDRDHDTPATSLCTVHQCRQFRLL